MKRILLDENMDHRLKRLFNTEDQVQTVRGRGWGGKKNGNLLSVAELEFDILVTLDRNMQHQQNLSTYDLAVILILSYSSRRAAIEPAMAAVNQAVSKALPGTLTIVDATQNA